LTGAVYIRKFFTMDITAPKGALVPRPLQWGLLLYEALRLAVLIRVMTRAGGEAVLLITGAANALFFFMALFLLADFRRHAAYVPLYVAGKILMALVAAGCGLLGHQRILQAIILGGESLLYAAGGLAGIALGDLISAGAGMFLLRYSKPAGKDRETGGGDQTEPGAAPENGGL
jgi:hypothetical protein